MLQTSPIHVRLYSLLPTLLACIEAYMTTIGKRTISYVNRLNTVNMSLNTVDIIISVDLGAKVKFWGGAGWKYGIVNGVK